MSWIVPILRAARCRSTHHFFAIDALERVGTERGTRLRNLLLKYYADYLKGAKDPDDTFKDFQNHVLHVTQNNWGGAPKACQQWLERSVEHLNLGQWNKAAYALGVLSHYFTDPIMPLHTGQTERESVIHRPMEWSVCKAYDEINALCQYNRARYQITLGKSDDWLGRAVIESAKIANNHYERLIEIYNLARGTVDPPRGLTKEARQILSELFDLAIGGWAAVLMRISVQAMPIPDMSLSMATLIAGIDVPRAMIVRKFTDLAEQNAVKKIFEEFAQTGELRENLPAEIKVVRQELARSQQVSRSENIEVASASPRITPGLATKNENGRQSEPISERETIPTPKLELKPVQEQEPKQEPKQEPIQPRPTLPQRDQHQQLDQTSQREPLEDGDSLNSGSEENSATLLSLQSRLVDAPSIGPKTAKRFEELGIVNVEQFLEADAESMSEALNTSWIRPALLEDWQAQARLVCEVPKLCGYKAQLLVAVGCRSAYELAQASPIDLHRSLKSFCESKEAERILRSSPPPDAVEVTRWIEAAGPSSMPRATSSR